MQKYQFDIENLKYKVVRPFNFRSPFSFYAGLPVASCRQPEALSISHTPKQRSIEADFYLLPSPV